MHDTMHQIDNRVIISFLKPILSECVELLLGITGAAAKKQTVKAARKASHSKLASSC